MKNFAFALISAAILVLSLGACKKCYKCQVLSDQGLIEAAYLDNCGSNRDYQAYQKLCEENLKSGQVCDCSEL